MQENNDKNQGKNGLSFESLDILIAKWKDGTFSEIIDDWKWIFSYSVRYKWAIVFYTILGIFSTSMGLVSSVAGKYLIDIITGYKMNKLMILIIVMVGSSLFSLLFSSIISRISAKLSIYINNDIQADIFDKIVDADWLEINKYSNGDVLNRFNGDIGTVSSNAISWLPTIVIAIYNFIATFLVILHYNAVMAILALASAPFMLLMSRFMIKKQREIIWHRTALQPVNALVAGQIQRCQSGVQYVLHQDQYPVVGYGHGSGIHSVRILSVLAVDTYDHIWNDDIIPAAEKQSVGRIQ